MEVLHALLNGTPPGILMNSPRGMVKPAEGITVKTIPAPEEAAAKARYLLPNGNFYVPSEAVRNCLIAGGTGYRIGKVAASGVLSGAIGLLKGEFPLLDGDKKPYPGDKYVIDTRRVQLQSGRQRVGVLRSRALIEVPWMIEAIFSFNSELCSLENVKTALVRAGQAVGLLDFRPAKRGWFGKFEVEDIRTETI
ncbi:hypothetical protein ES707_00495 [subsurface metagenome]